jgi:hypothetical protein
LELLLAAAGKRRASVLADYLLATLAGELHRSLLDREVSLDDARAGPHEFIENQREKLIDAYLACPASRKWQGFGLG